MEFCCQHLSHGFRTRTGELVVLRDINYTVAQQEFVSLVGPSGCGKTTLLKLIAGLLKPTNGHIVFGAMGEHGRPGKPLARSVQILKHTSQLQQARERLARGELVRILPDGTEGEHVFPYAFYGRTRLFPAGFAELAAHSDAVVILARVFPELDGRFTITFSEPFQRPTPGLRHAEQVAAWLTQYVECLRRDWADAPWNIPWYAMKRHLALPEDVTAHSSL